MFNTLNSVAKLRKYSPQVCKFLDIVTGISHARLAAAQRGSHLLERLGFRNQVLGTIGLPIAVPSLRPAFAQFGGKGIR